MRLNQAYPFRPKSTASLRPGQFWAVPFGSGLRCEEVRNGIEFFRAGEQPELPHSGHQPIANSISVRVVLGQVHSQHILFDKNTYGE